MYLLNYIYFLIITLLGLKFLTMKRGVMVNPLNREQKMVMDGPEMFWVLTFSTGLLALSASRSIRFDGYSLNGIRDLLHSGPVYL